MSDSNSVVVHLVDGRIWLRIKTHPTRRSSVYFKHNFSLKSEFNPQKTSDMHMFLFCFVILFYIP